MQGFLDKLVNASRHAVTEQVSEASRLDENANTVTTSTTTHTDDILASKPCRLQHQQDRNITVNDGEV